MAKRSICRPAPRIAPIEIGLRCASRASRRQREMPAFARYVGIDYSGVDTPTASLKGLGVYLAEADAPPVKVLPPSVTAQIRTRRSPYTYRTSAAFSVDLPSELIRSSY